MTLRNQPYFCRLFPSSYLGPLEQANIIAIGRCHLEAESAVDVVGKT